MRFRRWAGLGRRRRWRRTAGSTQLSLLVPSYSDGTKGRWEKIISDFQAANPDIQVALEVQSWDNINDVVRTKVQANQAPDILNIDAYSGFAQDDLLYPATEIASPQTIADLQPSFVQNATLNGTQQALPLIASTRTLFYNTDLFAKAGIAAPPKTWAELQAAAEKVQALGLPDTYGYGMPLGSEEAQAETSIWTFGAGGNWGDANALTIDTPQNLEGLQAMRQLIDTKATQPDPGATDRTPLINVFIQGKLGMVEGLPPTVGQIKEKNPGLAYATAPIPTKDGTPATLGVADHLMAFRNNGDKAEAIKKFVDYFYSEPVYVGWVEAEGFLPVTKSGADRAGVQAGAQDLPGRAADGQVLPGGQPEVVGHPGCAAVAGRPDRAGQRPGGGAAAGPDGRRDRLTRSDVRAVAHRRAVRPDRRARARRPRGGRRPPRCWPPPRGWAGCCC